MWTKKQTVDLTPYSREDSIWVWYYNFSNHGINNIKVQYDSYEEKTILDITFNDKIGLKKAYKNLINNKKECKGYKWLTDEIFNEGASFRSKISATFYSGYRVAYEYFYDKLKIRLTVDFSCSGNIQLLHAVTILFGTSIIFPIDFLLDLVEFYNDKYAGDKWKNYLDIMDQECKISINVKKGLAYNREMMDYIIPKIIDKLPKYNHIEDNIKEYLDNVKEIINENILIGDIQLNRKLFEWATQNLFDLDQSYIGRLASNIYTTDQENSKIGVYVAESKLISGDLEDTINILLKYPDDNHAKNLLNRLFWSNAGKIDIPFDITNTGGFYLNMIKYIKELS